MTTAAAPSSFRLGVLWGLGILGLACASHPVSAANPPLDGFLSVDGGGVAALALQPDGALLVGGSFFSIAGQAHVNVARFASDGNPDSTFQASADGYVATLALQRDGRILVGGGLITEINGTPSSNLARLNADGSRDGAFDPVVEGEVYALAVQEDGKILVGGGFANLAGQPHANLGRLNPDGTLDESFTATADSAVTALCLQPDGHILVGGLFNELGGQLQPRLGRLQPDGSVETEFTPEVGPLAGGSVGALAVQPDGRILVGGIFQTLGGESHENVGRLFADGSVDTSFNPSAEHGVSTLAVQADGRILVGGVFLEFCGQERYGLGRLNPDGSLDEDYIPATDPMVRALLIQPDGKALVGGELFGLYRFQSTDPVENVLARDGDALVWSRGNSGPAVTGARFEFSDDGANWTLLGEGTANGTGWGLDGAEVPEGQTVRVRGNAYATQSSAAGWTAMEAFYGPPLFLEQPVAVTTVDFGSEVVLRARVVGSGPLSYQWQKDGEPLVDGGGIAGTETATLTRAGVAGANSGVYTLVASNSLGSHTSQEAQLDVIEPVIITQPADQTPAPGENLTLSVEAAASDPVSYQWQRDGEPLVDDGRISGSQTSTLNVTDASSADDGLYRVTISNDYGSVTSREAVVKVAVVTVDPEFVVAMGSSYAVHSLAVQPDGKILLGGFFQYLEGVQAFGIGRLFPDGSSDQPFGTASLGAQIEALAIQADGKILVGGRFSSLAGVGVSNLGRLNADGTADSAFNVPADDWVYCLALQPDGKILLAGDFTRVGGAPAWHVARINPDGTLDSGFAEVPGSLGTSDASIHALARQPDGRILIGGTSRTGGTGKYHLERLNPDGTLDSSFQATVDNWVTTLPVQPDGKILVGGLFTTVNGQPRARIARVNPDGSLDSGFNGSANGEVVSMTLQTDGRILLSGSFTELGGEGHGHVGRLKPDGSVDPSFRLGAEYDAYALALQRDGSIIVGGAFKHLDTEARTFVGRLLNTHEATETLIPEESGLTWLRGGASPEVSRTLFDSSTDGVNWTALGEATRIAGGWRLADVSVPEDAILRARGLVSGSRFNGGSSWVAGYFGRALILGQPDGGTFESGSTASLAVWADGTGPLTYQWFKDGEALEEDATHVGVQSPTLTLNDLWGPAGGDYTVVVSNPHGEVTSAAATLVVTGDPRIVAEPVSQVVNLGATATFQFGVEGTGPLDYQWWQDGTELPGANEASLVIENVQATQAGEYWAVAANDYGEVTSRVVTLGVNQALPEMTFDPVVGGRVYALAVQADDKILVGGKFTTINGETRQNLARLLPDGALDPEFNPGADSPVEAIAIQPDGGILVAGEFTILAGEPRQRIARLYPDGSLDPDFQVPVDNTIHALALQPDGRILIGGHFTLLDGEEHARIGRLNPDGSVDDGFAAGIAVGGGSTPSIQTLAVQPDGRIVVAGFFSSLNGESASNIGRLNPDGSRDLSFAASANASVYCLALQPDGRILVGGYFTVLNAQVGGSRLGRLHADGSVDTSFLPKVDDVVRTLALQADGRVLFGGGFGWVNGESRGYIARLAPDGSVDPDCVPEASWLVYAIALQSDGRILAGGWFTAIAGVERGALCRLSNTGPAVESLEYDDSIFWTRGGAAPEIWRATFEHTPDGSTWTRVGEGIRISGGWVVTPPIPLTGGNIRARGHLTGGLNNGSGWFVDTYSGPPLFLEQPEGQSAPKQSLVTFSTRVVGSGPLAYQWHHDGLPLEDGDRVSGSQTPVLTVRDITGANSGEYTLVATNGLGETTSDSAVLSVLDPWIILQPESQTVAWGQRADFEIYAVGTGDLSYQWWKDGVEIPGANDPWLELTGLTADDGGDYWVVVTGPYGTSTSETATLRVVIEPAIVTQPASQLAGRDQEVSFTVEVWGEAPLTYEWYRNGEPLTDAGNVSGSRTATLTLVSLTPLDAADYTVRVTNALGSELSEVASLSVNSAGSDPSFEADAFGAVIALARQPDGQILVGGSFSQLGGQSRSGIGRLKPNGSLDLQYDPAANSTVRALAVQADGRAVLGGEFTTLGGESRNRIARLNPDGSLDPDFNPGANQAIYTLLEQVDGKILVGGEFTSLGGSSRGRLGRLNPDGTLDSFSPGMDGAVACLALLPDGNILVGGSFSKANGRDFPRLARLKPDGSADAAFAPAVVPSSFTSVNAVAVQPDGRILIGGRFAEVGGKPRQNLARLNADGTLDASFAPALDRYVYTMALQTDGAILLGGDFRTVDGLLRDRLARIASDGSVDPDFCPSASGSVYALALQPDGKVLAGGFFVELVGESHSYIGRLNNTHGAVDDLTRAGTTLTWLRGGSGPEVWRTTFEHSADGADWSVIGQGSRIEGGWELSRESLPEGGRVRARGQVKSGQYGGSTWFVEAYTGAPALITQPESRTDDFGTTATFSVAAAGSPPLSYQWSLDGNALSDDAHVVGAQAPELSIQAVSAVHAGEYTVTVSNASGSVTSESAILAVVDPLIIGQPVSQTLGIGQNGLLEVSVVGSEPLSYQWWYGEQPVEGGNAARLQLPGLEESDAGDYHVVVSNIHGSAISEPATLTLVDSPVITAQPGHLRAERGENIALGVEAVGMEPLEYHWWKDGSELVGAVSPVLELLDVQTSDGGWYQIVVRNAYGEATSDLVALSVNAALWDGAFVPELGFTYLPHLAAMAIQPDETILLGGPSLDVGLDRAQRLCRFRPDGTLDADFLPEPNGTVTCLAVLPDGKLLAGGSFTSVAGVTRNYLARLHPSGRLDRSFDARIEAGNSSNPYVGTLALQPDGKVVVGGDFRMVGGSERLNLARLNPDGTLDAGFAAAANQPVLALALQPDGSILVGGSFTVLAGEPRAYLARLNPDGSLDEEFDPGAGGLVRVLSVQGDGRLLVGGSFRSMGGESREWLARLNSDGTLDADFAPSITPLSLRSFSLQADGRIIVVGASRLNGVPSRYLGRLNQDGSLDFSFHPDCSWRSSGIALQSDGAMLVLADMIAGPSPFLPPAGFGRLNNTDPATQSLEYDGSAITWLRGGTSPEVWRGTFEYSSDETEWTLLESPSRISGGWELTDVSLPAEGTLRARGYVTGGQYNASSWFVETSLSLVPPTPLGILVGDGSPRFTEEGFGFDVIGTPDTTVVIDVSLDLWEWTELETLTLGAEPSAITDPAADLSGQRFYRVRQVP